ncbi:MAG TPA: GNAT family N-acetyltransferase [bacterium]|nr:GNAT family N-acetyltransferase [bacterium]
MEPKEIFIKNQKYTVEKLTFSDIADLEIVVRQWVRFDGEVLEEEVSETLERFSKASAGEIDYHYVVIRDAIGRAVGISGVRQPADDMLEYASEGQIAGEMVNVFLHKGLRRLGLGRVLFETISDRARELGYQELIWNSGPRYEDTAWGFYTYLVGEPIATAEDYYGKGRHAPIWRKKL